MQRKIILFELNEVPFKVLNHFCSHHPQSALARVFPQCYQHETYTEDVGHLSPWITWASLHRGVNNEKHFINDFGQDITEINQSYPPVWELLTRQGIKVGVFASLHTYPLPKDIKNYAFYLPDTFAFGPECFPKQLEQFQDFNLEMSRVSPRNVSSKIPWASALRFLSSLPSLGFKASTALDISNHLINERIDKWKVTRRRTYQSVLAFDIFMDQMEKTKPEFATFFTNHVASSMHRYWAAAFPEDYDDFQIDSTWVQTYGSEIDFAMQKADRFFARLLTFVEKNKDYVILLTSSMGQAATEAKNVETQLYVSDLNKLMLKMGLQPDQWQYRPSMLPQINLIVEQDHVTRFRACLKTLKIQGENVNFRESDSSFFSIDFGQENLYDQPQTALLEGQESTFADLGLENVEIQDRSGATAYHIPKGCLLIYDPLSQNIKPAKSQISTLNIAPAILNNFALNVPEYMSPHNSQLLSF
jgi:hypothetical protein